MYMFSNDEFYYSGSQPTEVEAIYEAVRECDMKVGDKVHVSEMKKIEIPTFTSFMCVDTIFENADEYIGDNYGCEDPLFCPKKDDEKSLMVALDKCWSDWAKKNPKVMDDYYMAHNPKEIVITEEHVKKAI